MTDVSAQIFYGKENIPTEADYCGGEYGTNWDNAIEICLENATVEGEYFVFDIVFSRIARWALTSNSRPITNIFATTLSFDYDRTVLSMNNNDVSFVFDPAWDPSVSWCSMTKELVAQASLGDYYLVLNIQDMSDGYVFPTAGTHSRFGQVRWKIQSGAGGTSGVKLRKSDTPRGSAGSLVVSTSNQPACIIQSGNADVKIGDNTPVSPEIKLLASSDKACAGLTQTFTATVDGNYDDIVWTLEDNSGNIVGTNVGKVESTVKGQATITWDASASGAYKLCGVPKLAGAADGNKYCESITVYGVPTITLAYDNSKTCAGETVVLTPQISKGGTTTDVANELIGFNWTIGIDPTSKANTKTYSVVLPATKTAYHFEAVTNDAGACPVNASIDLQGGAAPAIVDASIVKELPLLGTPLSGNTYYKGDMIKLSVDHNINYSYEWKLGSTPVSSTNAYTIASATASSYVGSVQVTDQATNCQATANFNLVQDVNGCGVLAAVTDFEGNASAKICTNGVALLKATATLTCASAVSGNFVLSYAWYKKDGSNWVRQDSVLALEKNENIFAAQSAGDYQVRVYTNRGMATAQITVTTSGSIASGDVVTTETPLTVKRGNTTILIANSSVAQSYLWMPENMFATGGNKVQYPETKAIEENTQFKVYATHYDGCVSMATAEVEIGDDGLKVTAEAIGNPVCDKGKARMIAHVEGGSGNYAYKWTEDTRSFLYSTTEQEAVIDVNEDATVSLTRVVVVTDTYNGKKGIGSVQVNVLNLKGPELDFEGITDHSVCQAQVVKVKNKNTTAIASYDWYIKNNTTNVYTTKLNAGAEYTFNDRGDYTVWVAARTNPGSYCYSDTVNTKIPVSVKGFDLAWTDVPASAYVSGQTLIAAVEAKNSSGYKFTWTSPVGGTQSSATQNPNKFTLEGAYLPEYWFKVKATDANKCERSDSVKVSKNDLNDNGLLLTLAAKEVNYCTGGTAVMSATVSGGAGPYDFSWYTEGNESSPLQGPVQVTASGGSAVNKFISNTVFSTDTKIIVKVTDASSPNKLIRRDTVLVKKVNAAAPKISAGVDRIIAYNTSTYLLGTVVSGNPTSWVWADAKDLMNGVNTPNPQTKPLTQEKTFTAYAIDNNGCTSTSDDVKISVTAPGYELAVSIDKPSLLCQKSVVTLDANVTPAGRNINAWEWGATLGSISNKALENPELTINSVSTDTKMDLLVMVTDESGVTAVDRAKDITVQSTVAPELKLSGYMTGSGDYLCSNETQLVVSAVDPNVTLGACTWYVNNTEVRNEDGSVYTKTTYKHSVESAAYLEFKVSAVSLAGCPASNTITQSIQAYPQPKLDWDVSSTSSPVQPGDQVAVTAKLVKETSANYKYIWKHDGPVQTNPPTYTDGGTTASTATSATSNVVLATGANEDTSPYYFQVKVEDKYSCHSEQITKTITLDGNALFVTLASKYGEYCTNGGDAVLEATTVTDIDEKNLKYTWYKDGVVIPGEEGKELLVKNSDVGSAYYVEVEATDGSGKTGTTVANPFTLTAKAGTAPVLVGVNQKIPKKTKTALVVTTTANIVSWQWKPEDKLAVNESALRSPYTVILDSPEQKYTVYGVDANQCVGSAEVTVETIGVTVPDGEDGNLFVKVSPSPDTICKGNRLAINTKVWASASDHPTYEWLPNDGNLSAYDVAQPVFNATGSTLAAKTYSYTVLVRQGALIAAARADIVVIDGVSPNLIVDTDNSGSYCAGSSLVVKVQNNVPIKKYTWIINGRVDETITGNTYTWPQVLTNTSYSVRVIAESQQYCRSLDSVKVDEVIAPALKLNPLQVIDSCGQVKIFSDAGNTANYNWTLTSGNTYLDKVEGVTKDTLYLTQKTPAFTAAAIEYGVKLIVTPKNGGCASEGSLVSKVYFKPQVKLASWTPAGESVGLPYIVAEKGTSVQLRVADRTYDATVNSTVNWLPAQVQGSATAAILNNVQKDDSLIIVVSNKELATCMASDTMPVYLYPEAPKVDIDTNTCLTDIAIKWESLVADSVRVWGILEDAYNLSGGGYKLLASQKMSTLKWVEPNMNDRLKFYYLQSVRTIQGRVFAAKIVSDTVGWLKQTLYGVNIVAGAAENIIAYPFDMTSKGIKTDRDLFLKLIDTKLTEGGGVTGEWDFKEQMWHNEVFMDFGSGVEGIETPFDLEPGKQYNVVFDGAAINDGEVLMYGKLPSPYTHSFKFNTNGNPNETFVLYPLSLANRKSLQALGDALKCDFLGTYNFSEQIYDNIMGFDFGSGIMWSPDESDPDSPVVKPWTPIRFNILEELINWSR